MKASENEIFFVEDDVEPNTEGQFNDIPTKLELRTNDLCTHLINKSLLKEFMLIFRGNIRVLTSHFRRNFDIFGNFRQIHFERIGRGEGTRRSTRTFTPSFTHVLPIIMLGWVDLVHIHLARIFILF